MGLFLIPVGGGVWGVCDGGMRNLLSPIVIGLLANTSLSTSVSGSSSRLSEPSSGGSDIEGVVAFAPSDDIWISDSRRSISASTVRGEAVVSVVLVTNEDCPRDWNRYSGLEATVESLSQGPLLQPPVLAADGRVFLENVESIRKAY